MARAKLRRYQPHSERNVKTPRFGRRPTATGGGLRYAALVADRISADRDRDLADRAKRFAMYDAIKAGTAKCYACDATAVSTRDNRVPLVGGELEPACERHTDDGVIRRAS